MVAPTFAPTAAATVAPKVAHTATATAGDTGCKVRRFSFWAIIIAIIIVEVAIPQAEVIIIAMMIICWARIIAAAGSHTRMIHISHLAHDDNFGAGGARVKHDLRRARLQSVRLGVYVMNEND